MTEKFQYFWLDLAQQSGRLVATAAETGDVTRPILVKRIASGGRSPGRDVRPASVVSQAKIYNRLGTCYAVWHVGKQHSTGDNG